MKLNNSIIYQYANDLMSIFDNKDLYIPAKANFFIQKNLRTLAEAAQEIEKSRLGIAQHYGTLNEKTQAYDIAPDKMSDASKELADLFNIEQELNIKTFAIEALGDTQFTPSQMQAIMFMIEEDE